MKTNSVQGGKRGYIRVVNSALTYLEVWNYIFLSAAVCRFVPVNEVMVSDEVETYMTDKVNNNYLCSITGIGCSLKVFLNLITLMMV